MPTQRHMPLVVHLCTERRNEAINADIKTLAIGPYDHVGGLFELKGKWSYYFVYIIIGIGDIFIFINNINNLPTTNTFSTNLFINLSQIHTL